MQMQVKKPIIKIAGIVFLASVLLATTFQIIQSSKDGCWSGDETTNFPLPDGSGKVLCCNGISQMECGFDGLQCLSTGSAPHCEYQACLSCFVLWGIAFIAFVIVCINVIKQMRARRANVYTNIQ